MKRHWLFAAVAATALASCDGTQGTRGPCSSPTGQLVECEPEQIETPEDVCWKLVDCGVIPLQEDENDPDTGNRNWSRCVNDLRFRTPDELTLVLTCVAAASCDDLLMFGSPRDPYGASLCFEFGETD